MVHRARPYEEPVGRGEAGPAVGTTGHLVGDAHDELRVLRQIANLPHAFGRLPRLRDGERVGVLEAEPLREAQPSRRERLRDTRPVRMTGEREHGLCERPDVVGIQVDRARLDGREDDRGPP